MGKNLKGKEIGKGICQRKDGLYTARFISQDGVRREKYFKTIPEARNWLADAIYLDRHSEFEVSSSMTVAEWFSLSRFAPRATTGRQASIRKAPSFGE